MIPCERISPRDDHYFFAYYDKLQFSHDDRYVLMQRAEFCDRQPRTEDMLRVGMVDLEADNKWIELGQTNTWCWQQGCMLQWLPRSENRVIFNVRGQSDYASTVVDVISDERRQLPRAIYCLHPSGEYAISLDFARIAHTRPGYGYEGIVDPCRDDPAPRDRGLWSMRLEDGRTKMLFSFAEIAAIDPNPTLDGAVHWFNHALYNPSGSRLVFLHRWQGTGRRHTRMYTCNCDGSELFCISDSSIRESWHASHFWWRDDKTMVMWGEDYDDRGGGYLLVEDRTTYAQRVLDRDLLPTDGHMSFRPDGGKRLLLSDDYPDRVTNLRNLFLYDIDEERRIDLGRFDAGSYSPYDPQTNPLRCDLHPRWSRRGHLITFDSVHEGFRGVYMMDITPAISP